MARRQAAALAHIRADKGAGTFMAEHVTGDDPQAWHGNDTVVGRSGVGPFSVESARHCSGHGLLTGLRAATLVLPLASGEAVGKFCRQN